MNERIKENWEKATGSAIPGPGFFASASDYNIEKFAELIVAECIGCCEQVISDPVRESVDTWLKGGEQCIVEIREHFGVEE